MRSNKTLSITMPSSQFKEVERLARQENRTPSELVAEALRYYQEQRQNNRPRSLTEAIRLVREDAKAKGTDKMGMRDIKREIAEYRREKRGNGGVKRRAK
jgi:metal-responsive CopG/Arc/MetJ family transcriptional regulator